jgi:hypothetical protein
MEIYIRESEYLCRALASLLLSRHELVNEHCTFGSSVVPKVGVLDKEVPIFECES